MTDADKVYDAIENPSKTKRYYEGFLARHYDEEYLKHAYEIIEEANRLLNPDDAAS